MEVSWNKCQLTLMTKINCNNFFERSYFMTTAHFTHQLCIWTHQLSAAFWHCNGTKQHNGVFYVLQKGQPDIPFVRYLAPRVSLVFYKASNSSILCLVLPWRIRRRVLYLSRPARTLSSWSRSVWVCLFWTRACSSSELRVCGGEEFPGINWPQTFAPCWNITCS